MIPHQLLMTYGADTVIPVQYIASNTVNLTSSSVSWTPPAGSQIGDFVVAYIRSSSYDQATAISGWTSAFQTGPTIINGTGVYIRGMYKVLTAVTSQNLTITNSTSGVFCLMSVFRNVRTTTPITNISTGGYTNAGAGSPAPLSPSLTGAISGQMICYVMSGSTSITLTPSGSSGSFITSSSSNSRLRYRRINQPGDYAWTGSWTDGTGSGRQHAFVLNPKT
jgi:hypothetical protein